MGREIGGREFSEQDFARFRNRLAQETRSLRELFASGQCSDSGPFIGLELELWLIDHNFFPAPHNQSFLERLVDPSVVAELSQFNIEINAPVERLAGRSFRRMHAHLSETMRRCANKAHEDVDTVIAIGTLPNLRQQDLSLEAMTPSHRYYALNREAMRLRGGMPLNVDIDAAFPGANRFLACFKDLMLEVAATSFHLHLQVPPAIISRTYNASVILSAPLIAIAANSPFLFGQALWKETRIPIFEQSLQQTHGLQRVTLGTGYAGDYITELFEENLRDYPVLLPVDAGDPVRCYSSLRLQNGTIWRWVRPIVGFDPDRTPHVRIEQRVLPAGPSISDMMANAALYFGAVHMLARKLDDAEAALPFAVARQNFYQAVRRGLGAEIHWLEGTSKCPVRDIIDGLIPLAAEGLAALGMDDDCPYTPATPALVPEMWFVSRSRTREARLTSGASSRTSCEGRGACRVPRPPRSRRRLFGLAPAIEDGAILGPRREDVLVLLAVRWNAFEHIASERAVGQRVLNAVFGDVSRYGGRVRRDALPCIRGGRFDAAH